MSENISNIKTNFVDISNNIVYIHGEFSDDIISLLPDVNSIILKQQTLKEGKITFDINSKGGYVYILMSLINLIEKAKKQGIIVETIVQHMAYSCGSLLACSGTTGNRYIAEYGEHLCHVPRTWQYSATPVQVQRNADYLLRQQNNAKQMYKKYCDPTANKGYIVKLFENMKDDCFYINAKDSIKYGLADKIYNEI